MGTKTIEVNGTYYDATTGAVVTRGNTGARRGQNIDGFFRSRTTTTSRAVSPAANIHATPAPAPQPHTGQGRAVNHARRHTPQAAGSRTVHVREVSHAGHTLAVHHHAPRPVNHTKAARLQNSTTLMRTAVRRPEPSLRARVHPASTLPSAVPNLIVPKHSAVALDESRLARARQAGKSPLVSHHGEGLSRLLQPQFGLLAVQPAPTKPGNEDPLPPPPQPTNKPTDIFEHAMANATHFVDVQAHRAHFNKKARRHALSLAAGVLALLVIAGFAAYQNSPGLQFKVASIHAGVATHAPNLKAAGFAYDGVKTESNTLVVGFSSASGNYRLSQQTTNLSNQDMIHEVGSTDASGNPDYTTVQAGNTTVYRLGNTEATWVKGGVWYTVNGSGVLSDQQLTSLVKNV